MTTEEEERLHGVEQQLAAAKRRSRWMFVALCLVAAGLLLCGIALWPSDQIRAQQFIVVDEQGRERAQLGADEDEGSGLMLLGESGTLSAMLFADKRGPALAFFDENEQVRSQIGINQDGPLLHLYDEHGRFRAGIRADTADSKGPGLALMDGNGTLRAVLRAGNDGAAVSLYDAHARLRARMSLPRNGPGLHMYNEAGRLIWSAP